MEQRTDKPFFSPDEAQWSEAERAAFRQWLERDGHERLLRRWADSDELQRDLIRLRYLEERREANLNRFLRAAEKGDRRTNVRRRVWAAAASVLLVLGCAWWWMGRGSGLVGGYIAADYAPASLTVTPSLEYKLGGRTEHLEILGVRIRMEDDRIAYTAGESVLEDTVIADSLLYHEVVVPRGRMCEVELTDGTRVKLNAASRLRYPIAFHPDSTSRTVWLDGEAYFDVQTDSVRPFIVKASNVETRVYGTKFNVKAYARDARARVMLEEGRLDVVGRDGRVHRLVPGDYVAYDYAGLKEYERGVDAAEVTCWQDYRFFFKNEMLMFIAADLERKYDVNIYFDNYKASTFRFYARTHRCEHVEEVLDLLRYTQKIDYRVDGRDIYIRLHE